MSTLKFVDLQVSESLFDVKDFEAFQDHSNVNILFSYRKHIYNSFLFILVWHVSSQL